MLSRRTFCELGWAGAGSMLCSGVTFAIGLMIVRFLSKTDYAVYALATGVFSLVAGLSNSGVSVATTAIAGEEYPSKKRIGTLLASAKKALAVTWVCSVAIAAVFLLVSGINLGLGWPMMGMLLIYAAFTSRFSLVALQHTSVLLVFHQLPRVSIVDMAITATRSAVLSASLLVQPLVPVLLLVNALSEACRQMWLGRIEGTGAVQSAPDPRLVARIHSTNLKLLPYGAFFAFQGQIMLFVLGFVGDKIALAEVSAVGRLALIGGILAGFLSRLAQPRCARATSRKEIVRITIMSLASTAGVFACILIGGLLYPGVVPLLLGSQYRDACSVFFWIVLSSGLSCMAGVVWSILMGKAMTTFTWIGIPLTIAIQAAIVVIGKSQVSPVMLAIGMGAAASCVALVVNLALLAYNLRSQEVGVK